MHLLLSSHAESTMKKYLGAYGRVSNLTNFYEGDVQVWRPYSRFPRSFGTRLTKSKVCRSGTRANSVYMENFILGWRLTFANL